MSKIQWTDQTANPVKEVGGGNYCIPISPGCQKCYASVLNSRGTRFGGNGRKFGVRPEGHPEMALNFEMLAKWPKMRKPKRIFVGSMTDIFGEWVPDWMIFTLLDAMAESPLQTFQLLTKRPQRAGDIIARWLYLHGRGQLPKNIWLGASAENQIEYDKRVKWLSRCLAQVRFLSLEPLLDFIKIGHTFNAAYIESVDWVIVGGESGPGARPLSLDWIYEILDQSKCHGIPVFIKQLGSHWARETGANDSKGGDPDEWPEKLQIRMFPGEEWE